MNTALIFKRAFDFLMAALGILILIPLLAIFSVAGALCLRGNPFFVQQRPGIEGRIFRLLKFRTMTNDRDSEGKLFPDHARMTKWGKFLRATSFDELPQLWNVVIGDMSLVGPRPLLPEYLNVYTATELKRHTMRPGITGWAQVNGRNSSTWDERLNQDVWYVENWTLGLDFFILAKTIFKVLKREGVMSSQELPMPSLVDWRKKQGVLSS